MISPKTATEILDILVRFGSRIAGLPETRHLLRELSEVKGNKSFSNSMKLLLKGWDKRIK